MENTDLVDTIPGTQSDTKSGRCTRMPFREHDFNCSGMIPPCFPEVVDSVTRRLMIQAAVAAKCALQEDLCRFLGFLAPVFSGIGAFSPHRRPDHSEITRKVNLFSYLCR
jgi:hypothetical protein